MKVKFEVSQYSQNKILFGNLAIKWAISDGVRQIKAWI